MHPIDSKFINEENKWNENLYVIYNNAKNARKIYDKKLFSLNMKWGIFNIKAYERLQFNRPKSSKN